MRNALIAAALLVTASTAVAQPALTQPIEPTTGPAPTEVKSESTATLLAIGVTLGGMAMIGAGAERDAGTLALGGVGLMMIGPSAGHFYAGETSHGLKMSLLRTGGLLVFGVGAMSATNVAACAGPVDGGGGGCGTDSDRRTGEKMMWLGGATVIGATLYDLWDAHNAARHSNDARARAWSVAPALLSTTGGGTTPAVSIAGAW